MVRIGRKLETMTQVKNTRGSFISAIAVVRLSMVILIISLSVAIEDLLVA